MTLVLCWILFPVVLGLLALGCGLLLEPVAGVRIPGALLPAAGLAVIVVVVHFLTLDGATAELSTPAVVALAIVGLAFFSPRRRGRPDGWAVAAALGVYLAFSAPVVLSGQATFAGYIKLDDTATWLAITDHVIAHGRDLHGLAPSSYEATLELNLPGGYPIGAFLPLGVGRDLVGQDSAWVFQPYLALLAAALSSVLYVLIAPLVKRGGLRALSAFVASQAALLYGYSLWGGVKELAAAWVIGLVAALAAPAVLAYGSVRSVVPLALAIAATLAILSFGGIVWIVPLVVPALVLLLRARGLRFTAGRTLGIAAAAAVLALPSLLKAETFLRPAGGTLTSGTDLGNLIKPLNWLQFFGIWPVGDFRLRPASIEETYLLIAVVALAGLLGLALASRRAPGIVIYVVGSTVGCALVAALGSPWIDGKALATASPAFVFAALAGGAAVYEAGRRVEALLVVAAVAGGVLWSNALAYQDVNLAPRDRFAELQKIGERFAGQGPTLMTDYEPYGVRHFLRKEDPEGASELRRRTIPLRDGRSLPKLGVADIDQFQLAGLLVYRTLVLRRSPVASRPPSIYTTVWRGRYYEVWQRPEPAPPILRHLPLGDATHPTATPSCGQVLDLARLAGEGGRLAAAVRRSEPIIVDLAQTSRSPAWQPAREAAGSIYPATAGEMNAIVSIPKPDRYDFWVGGSFRRRLELLVDRKHATAERHELSHSGEYIPLGTVPLGRGYHRLTLRGGGADLHPGSGDPPFYLGPLILSPPSRETIRYVDPREAGSLCGRNFDWIEALGP
jgi:hypothetical protein